MKFLICHFSQILIPSNICDIANNNRVDIICFTIIHYCSGHFMKIVVNTVSPVLYRQNLMVINGVYASAGMKLRILFTCRFILRG